VGEPKILPPPRANGPPSGEGTTTARYLFFDNPRPAAFFDGAFEKLWGMTAQELRRDPSLWLGRIHPDDRPRAAANLAAPAGASWEHEYRVVREDGSVVWILDRGQAADFGRGRQVAGRVVDVTARRVLEEQLRSQAQLLAAVGEAVMAADVDGLVTAWNPAAGRLYGVSAREAIGRPIVELLAAADGRRQEIAKLLAGILAGGESWAGELPRRHRDGLDMPTRLTLSPLLGKDDAVIGVAVSAFDVSAARAAEARLRDSEDGQRQLVAELRRLTSHLQVVREQEQTRIAREIHDELGKMLTGLKLAVNWLRRRAGNGHQLGGEQLRERLDGVAQLVDHTLDAVRHIARQLRPPALDDLGLETAIRWLVEEFQTRTGIPCELHAELPSLPPGDARDTAAFRILQEGLTNVARHAEATRVMVRVRRADDALLIELIDDGKGVPRAAVRAPGSLGILGMRERAVACGGELIVRRLPSGGTRVRARLPIGCAVAAPAAELVTAEKEAS
jgi:two-component system sensor histidine kinase UhpB